MYVFRLHIRPKGGLANPSVSFAYCLREQVLGVGWQTYSDKVINSWADYEAEASKVHEPGELSRVRYFHKWVKADDLIWTRCPAGHYYLAKVNSGWLYLTSPQAEDADIVNVVRCDIRQVGAIDKVPGKVVACFRPNRTIQEIADDHMWEYSRQLWNKLSGTDFYPPDKSVTHSVFLYLGAEETEDIIFLYLQTKGWLVVPNSRKGDTMSYEFYLIHRETRQRAGVQVKTGDSGLNVEDWKDRPEYVFLFQANGLYSGGPARGVECLAPTEIEIFMVENRDLLPRSTLHWMDHVGLGTGPSVDVNAQGS
ncbi:hypothetical protein [Brevifollis gellanilyticus]|nr:hypothetical protein [Brevifollis gellanilyticus]